MGYRLKLFGRYMKNVLKRATLIVVIELLGILFCVWKIYDGGLSIRGQGLFLMVILIPLFIIIGGIKYVNRAWTYTQIYEEKGFCPEYRDAFEAKHIRGNTKATNLEKIQYAEIHLYLGEPQRCIFLLNQLQVPESDKSARAWYLITYMKAAAEMKDAELATDVWNKNHDFISRYIAENQNTSFFETALVLKCCYTRLLCIRGNYQGALDSLNGAIPQKKMKSGVAADFYILQTYIYHMLGDSAKEEKSAQYSRAAIENGFYELEISRRCALNDLEKALSGEMAI